LFICVIGQLYQINISLITVTLFTIQFFSGISVGFSPFDRPRYRYSPDEIYIAMIMLFESSLAFGAIVGVSILSSLQIREIKKGLTQFEASFDQPIHAGAVKTGLIFNLKKILGPNILLWLWPNFITDYNVLTKNSTVSPKKRGIK